MCICKGISGCGVKGIGLGGSDAETGDYGGNNQAMGHGISGGKGLHN